MYLRLMFGELVGGKDPGAGCPERNWQTCLKDDFKAFVATHGSTDDQRRVFGVPNSVWAEAAKVKGGRQWYKGVLPGAERFMTSWHKDEEEASRKRATKREKERSNNKETPRTNGTGGVRKKGESAREGNKREMADRVARYVPD